MKAKLILIAAAGVLLGTLAMAPPAEAGHLDWSFGVGFHVGGLHFRVGFAPYGYTGYPGPFFLTTERLHYPGYGCHGACFRRGAGFYHHASCPLLGLHFGSVGYAPGYYVHNYSPYRGYGRGYGRGYAPYRGRDYRPYYGDGHRDRFRPHANRHYRGDRHYRGRGPGDRRHNRPRVDQRRRPEQGRQGYDRDRGRNGERGRSLRGDRGRRGRGDEREQARPRRGARNTRPPG